MVVLFCNSELNIARGFERIHGDGRQIRINVLEGEMNVM